MNPPNAPSANEDLAVILAGAGEGVRMGGLGPKLLLPVGGRTLLQRVTATFLTHPAVGEIVAAVPERLVNDASHAIESIPNPRRIPIRVVTGGATRQRSVTIAMAALTRELRMVAIHDVARALVRADLVTRVLEAARRDGAAIPALPVRDTIKEVEGGRVARTVPRATLAGAQTPQIFTRDMMLRALAAAETSGLDATDDAALVEETGSGDVTVVPGDPTNLKLTEPSDVTLFEALIRSLERP